MKNSLEFKIQFSNLWCLSFVNCFAAAYIYLEGQEGDLPKKCGEDSICFGCAGCSNPEPQSVYFCLFDTMCGRSALHLRFDGVPTEMTKLIGDGDGTGGWSGKCGTVYTTDFLFGFAGYEYRKVTDAAMFKNEIIASIDAGKPVIAECMIDNGAFRVITGYDGDMLINSYCLNGQQLNDAPCTAPSYDELKVLYIIGDKVTPRYTLKDGLERIKRVMENNINEKIWDMGIEEINNLFISPTGGEAGQINPDELNELRNRITKTITNQFNSHTFNVPFFNSQYGGLQDPALLDLWKKVDRCQMRLGDYAHTAGHFNGINIAGIGLFRPGLGKMFVSAIEDIKSIHLEMLEIINQAIEILDKK
jgi:hypothetical protein